MITLAVFNLVLNIFDYLLTHVFSTFYNAIPNLTNSISSLQIPQSLYDILALTYYFLPMGTVGVLFDITIALILGAIIYAFVYALLNIIKQVPLL